MRPFLFVTAFVVLPGLLVACATGSPNASPHPPDLPANVDLADLSRQGEDVPELAPHAARGKVTLFDFYATWCSPCRTLDAHLVGLLAQRRDLAVRKLNVVTWDTPLAVHYLKDAPYLPLVIVYGKDARLVGTVAGLDVAALDRAIEKASRP